MRTRLLILFLLLFSGPMFSQNLVIEGRQWNILTMFWGSLSTQIFKIEGDSNNGSFNYKKIWITYDNTQTGWNLAGLIREDSGKVYFMQNSNQDEYLIYDFNIQIDDTVMITNYYCDIHVYCSNIDTLEYNGILRKRYKIDHEWGANLNEYWIEGIGSNEGLFYTHHEVCISDVKHVLLCYYENDTLMYQSPYHDDCYLTNVGLDENTMDLNIKIIPNPVTGTSRILIPEIIKHEVLLSIYDYQGKLLSIRKYKPNEEILINNTQFNPGIYIYRIIVNNTSYYSGKFVVL